ncbi:hypothetical protein N186_01980 [Thermofilum adornatum]|uniref:Uncharacterized protein n=1 Tax=Thermofilum adornatum TaxID=1365176 RepID=S5ZJV0_9CREN|nr:hypothetical protein N186_01980 [Thermofilum adornatum]
MYIFYVLVVMLGEAWRRILWASMQFLAEQLFLCGIWLAIWLGYLVG